MNTNDRPKSRLAGRLALSVPLFLAGTALAPAQDQATIRVMSYIDFTAETPAARDRPQWEAAKRFAAENPDVRIEYELVPAFDIYRLYLIQARGGNPPDVAYHIAANTYTIAKSGLARPLNDYMEGHPTLNPANLEGSLFNQATVEGRHYAVPDTTDARLVYYRKDLFAEAGLDPDSPPLTREQLIDYARKLTRDKDGDGRPDQWGYCFVMDNTQMAPHFWLTHVYSAGGGLVDEAGKAIYDSEAGVEAARFYHDLVNTWKVSPSTVIATNYDETLRQLIAGTCAMAMLGSWSWTTDLMGSLGAEKVGWTRIPPPEGGISQTFGGGPSWMISAASRHPDIAWKFIAAMTSDETHIGLAKASFIPVKRNLLHHPEIDGSFSAQMGEYLVEGGHGNPKVLNSQPLLSGLRQALQDVIQGNAEPADALAKAAQAYNAEYADR